MRTKDRIKTLPAPSTWSRSNSLDVSLLWTVVNDNQTVTS